MDFSPITDGLIIGTTPTTDDYDTLRELGVALVINMRGERPPHPDGHKPPMPTLWLHTFDSPLLPISLRSLRRGVQAALERLDRGEKVYTHCAAGVHRSVAMAAAILIAQGLTAQEAMALIKDRRQVADPHKWYIRWRILRFSETWENHK